MPQLIKAFVLFSGMAAAIPAPTPSPTPPARLRRRQDPPVDPDYVTGDPVDGCTMTYGEVSVFENPILSDAGDTWVSVVETITIPEGNHCSCDNDKMRAGVTSKLGDDGKTTLYCNPDDNTSGRTPQSTIVPENSPGEPDNEGCKNPMTTRWLCSDMIRTED